MNGKSSNRKMYWLLSLLALAAMLLAACQPAATPTQAAQPAATMPPAPTAPAATAAPMATEAATALVPQTGAGAVTEEPTINVANDPKLGQILVDGKGMTLYMFKKDEPNKSNCADKCLAAWPPLLTNGSPVAGSGVDASLLGSASLPDGRKIVTYNKMPLYYWVKDAKPGDTTGQDVNKVWYVVAPNGSAIETSADGSAGGAAPTAAPTASSSSGSSDDTYGKGGSASSDDVKILVANDPKFGPILVDAKGMTLYMFTKDEADKSNCAGKCLDAWPPLVDNGKVKAEDGVNQSMLGSASLPDGSKIVTYNHMPLYYWAGDVKAGDTSGQGVNSVWYVVSPDGKPVGQ